MSALRGAGLLALLAGGLVLPFMGRPVHLDEANFLVLAQSAARSPWGPHETSINWQGTTEEAFAVLSNPPGVAWWLAPVAESSVVAQHLWMLPWLALFIWGAWRLGGRFAGRSQEAAVLLITSPMVVLASHSLMPDMPLVALITAGLAGFIDEADRDRPGRTALWALVVGAGALFRYSALAVLPLLPLYLLLGRRKLWPAAAALAPIMLLLAHDLLAYGELHILAMTGFQGVSMGGRDLLRKAVAAVVMLGGAGVLPLVTRVGRPVALAGGAVGLCLGVGGAVLSALPLGPALLTAAMGALGGAALAGPLAGRMDRDSWFLGAWLLLGFVFLIGLRFMAARYWLPFLPAVAMGWLRLQPPRGLIVAAACVQATLALGVALDDQALARGHATMARHVDEVAGRHGGAGPRLFAGHWGWQHALEAAGWSPMEEGAALPEGALLAWARAPWPQEPREGTCLEPLAEFTVEAAAILPRVHTWSGRANHHAFMVSDSPPLETYAPWGVSRDPHDRATLYRVCR